MAAIEKLTEKMIEYYRGDPKRIQHFIKVHAFARHIGAGEGLDEKTQFILESAALVHDIGIKPAEEKYGECGGKLQEQEGPAPAEKMLRELSYGEEEIKRICYLVSRHHTYNGVEGEDYRILLEADFLVNLYEDGLSAEAAKTALERIFRTKSGIKLCREMFGLTD